MQVSVDSLMCVQVCVNSSRCARLSVGGSSRCARLCVGGASWCARLCVGGAPRFVQLCVGAPTDWKALVCA